MASRDIESLAKEFFDLLLRIYEPVDMDPDHKGFKLQDQEALHRFQREQLGLPASHATIFAKAGIGLAERRMTMRNLETHLALVDEALKRDDFSEIIPRWMLCTEYGGFWHALIPSMPYDKLERIASALSDIGWHKALYEDAQYWIDETMPQLKMGYVDMRWSSRSPKDLAYTFEHAEVLGFQPAICTGKDGRFDYFGMTYAAKRLPISAAQAIAAPKLTINFVQDLMKILNEMEQDEEVVRYPEKRKNPSLVISNAGDDNLELYILDRGPQSDVFDTLGNLLVYYKGFSDLSARMHGRKAITQAYLSEMAAKEREGKATPEDYHGLQSLMRLTDGEMRILRQPCIFGDSLFQSLEVIHEKFPRRSKNHLEVTDFDLKKAHGIDMGDRIYKPSIDWKALRYNHASYSAPSFVSKIRDAIGDIDPQTKIVVSYSDSIYVKSTLLSGSLYTSQFETYMRRYSSSLPPLDGEMDLAYRYDALERIKDILRKDDPEEYRSFMDSLRHQEERSGITTIDRSASQGIMCKIIDLRKMDVDSLPAEFSGLDSDTVILDLEYALGDQIQVFTQEIARQIAKPYSLWATTKVAGIGRDVGVGDVIFAERSFGSDIGWYLVQDNDLHRDIDRLDDEGAFAASHVQRQDLEKIVQRAIRGTGALSSDDTAELNGIQEAILRSDVQHWARYLSEKLSSSLQDYCSMCKPLRNDLADGGYGPWLEERGIRSHRGNIGLVDSVVLQDSTYLKASNTVTRIAGNEMIAIDMECDYIGALVNGGIVGRTALAYFVSDHPVKGLTLANQEIPDINRLYANVNILPFRTIIGEGRSQHTLAGTN